MQFYSYSLSFGHTKIFVIVSNSESLKVLLSSDNKTERAVKDIIKIIWTIS